jgi:hypothetical protein
MLPMIGLAVFGLMLLGLFSGPHTTTPAETLQAQLQEQAAAARKADKTQAPPVARSFARLETALVPW